MISAFQLFKIILGVIMSVFVIIIAMQFSGRYIQLGESGKQVSTVINLKKAIEDVYTSGVPTDFRISDAKKTIEFYRPPNIITPSATVSLEPIPTLLVAGEDISIHRIDYDIGWWKFQLIEAVPDTKILFVPLTDDESAWHVIEGIAKYMPSTENTKTKVRFGVWCNRTEFYFGWEKNDFINKVIRLFLIEKRVLNFCENVNYLRKKGYKLVVITDDDYNADFLVKPKSREIGYVYITKGDEKKAYLYKNPLDIVSLLLGGETFYEYENKRFLKELGVAVNASIREANILMTSERMGRCRVELASFISVLNDIKQKLEQMNYKNEDDVNELNAYLEESSKIYERIDRLGCG